MDFALSERAQKFRDEVAAFVAGVDRDEIARYERESEFPHFVYDALAARGWAGVMVPEKYGGLGMGAIEMSIITEELGLIGLSGLTLTLHGQITLLKLGTEEQKTRYLPLLCKGSLLSAIVVSENDAGSNLKNLKTRAVRDGDHFIINGQKHHITLGDEAGMLILFAMTEKGLTTFIVDKATPGITTSKMDAIGWRLDPHYDISFENVRIPARQMLGSEGRGLDTFFASFNLTRVCNAAHLLGIARAAFQDGVSYAVQRNVGENKVADFQGIQWLIAELAVKIEVASLMRFKAAWMEDAGLEHECETAMSKLLALDAATSCANNVFSLVGGQGLYRSMPYERYLRDAKVGQATGGSPEIMKNNIARDVLRKYGHATKRK